MFLYYLIVLLDVVGIQCAGRYAEAEDIIHNSLRANLELDTVAYNTFIKALLEAGLLLRRKLLPKSI